MRVATAWPAVAEVIVELGYVVEVVVELEALVELVIEAVTSCETVKSHSGKDSTDCEGEEIHESALESRDMRNRARWARRSGVRGVADDGGEIAEQFEEKSANNGVVEWCHFDLGDLEK